MSLAEDTFANASAESDRWKRLYRAVLNNTPDLAYVWNLQHRFIYANDGLLKMWGKTWDQAIGKNCLELGYEPWHAEMHDREIDHVVRTKQPHRGEVPFTGTFGRRIYDYILVPVLNENGEVEAVAGTTRDVTERKEQEDAISQERSRFQVTLASIGDAVITTDTDGRVTFLNPVAETMTGWSHADTAGKPLTDVFVIINEITRHPAVNPIEKVLKLGAIVGLANHTTLISKTGKEFAIEDSAAPIRDGDGKISGAVMVFHDVSTRRKAEDDLRRSEAFNRSIIESSRDCIKTLSLDGKITWINNFGAKLLCIKEAKGLVWTDFWQYEYKVAAEKAVARAIAGQPDHFIGALMVDGQHQWWDVQVSPLSNATGTVELLLVVSRNITENVNAEVLSSTHSAMVESSDDAIITKSLHGIIKTWNPAAQRMFGYPQSDVIGKHISLLFPKDRISEESEIIAKIRAGQRIEHYETIRLRRDGTPLNVSLSISPIKNAASEVVGVAKIVRDVTEQHRSASVLEQRTQILEILNRTGQAIASELDLQKLVQIVTDAGTQISGAKFGAFFYNFSNAQGESFVLYALSGAPKEAFEQFGLPRNTPVFNPTFQGLGVVRSDDITKDPRYGKMAPHHGMPKGHLPVRSYLAAPVVSRNGDVIGGLFFGHPEADMFNDFTEKLIVGIAAQAAVSIDNARLYEAKSIEIANRKAIEEKLQRAKEEAEHANRAKDEFLAVVSHELRTPLTSILGWTKMLRTQGIAPEKQAHAIKVIERNTQLQAKLIEDLLDLSRVISGKLLLNVQPMSTLKAVTAAVDSIKQAADAKRIDMRISETSEDVTIVADFARLEQVLWNLLSNAVKFTPKEGRIDIHVGLESSRVLISVTDTGKGIDKEFLPHVFERFRQADSATTRVYGGLGLGLAIVRYLVEQHGGKVTAESEGANKGSTFTVELPIRAVTDLPVPDSNTRLPAQDAEKPLDGHRIVVVEDDPDSRELIGMILEAAGARCALCSSAEDALLEVKQQVPDLIISDIGMPLKDGYQFIKEVRSLTLTQQPLAIALTAFAREEDRQRALAAGFDHHMSKPVDPLDLIEKIKACLTSSK